MSNPGEALEAIVGLAVGGVIFIVFGSALAGTALGKGAPINLELWGILYFVVAIILAIAFVGGVISSILGGL